MSSIRIIYILLHLFMLWMFYKAGKNMSKTRTNGGYWRAAIPAFFSYFIVLGLRFGHNLDWNLYYVRYTECVTMPWPTTEPVYYSLLYFFNEVLGVPYFLFVSLQCMFLLYSFFILVKEFRDKLYFVVPLFPIVAQMNDNYFRWFIAVSFMLLSVRSFLWDKSKYKLKAVLLFLCSVLTHNGAAILIAIYLILLFKKKYMQPRIALILLFLSVFVISISAFSFLSTVGMFIASQGGDAVSDSSVGHYLESVDYITSNGLSDLTGILQHSFIGNIIIYLSYATSFICGPKVLQRYDNGIAFYNVFVVGAILNPCFSSVEIFDRFTLTLLLFNTVVSGIVFYDVLKGKVALFNSAKLICCLSVICLLFPYYKYVFLTDKDYRMMYMWNADNKKCIDTAIYFRDMGVR